MSDNLTWSSTADYNGISSFGFSTFYGNYMYFPNRGNVIQVNLDGSINNTNFLPFGESAPAGCLAYNGYLYVSNYNGGYGDGAITRINLADNTKINIWAQVGSQASSIVTDGTYLYISCFGANNVYRVLISNPATTNIFLSDFSTPRQIAISGNYLYLIKNGGNIVYRALLTNPSAYTSWASLTLSITGLGTFGLVTAGKNLYVSVYNFNAPYSPTGVYIYKIPLANPTSITIFKQFESGSVKGLTFYNDYLYAYISPVNTVAKYYIPSDIPPIPPCFKEGTKILTMKGYKLVQDLRKGDMVKTLRNDYKAIEMIGKKEFIHRPTPEDRVKEQLYVCSKTEFDQILEPLVITGCHSILVGEFVSEAQRQKTIEVNGDIYLTDNKYRLPACAHHQTTVYDQPGTYTIYHLALENEDYFMNYGIYANGLLVESCSRRYLKERSNMELIE